MFEPPYRIKNFVIGTIILWFGSIANIPSGWHLCNGNMGTPNLQNRFVVGAGDTYDVGDTGGSAFHTHSFIAGADVLAGLAGGFLPAVLSFLPPYHALCYIMKVN